MNDYEKQASDFLEKTGVTIRFEFLKNDYHFEGEKQKRDIYKVTISRGKRSFSFDFGQSVMDSQYYQDKNIKSRTYTLDGSERTGGYKILDIKKYSNFVELAKGKVPTSYSVLSCLTKYDVGSLEDFCSEFGYDADSKTADRTYKAVCEEYKNVCMIWSDDEIEELQEIN